MKSFCSPGKPKWSILGRLRCKEIYTANDDLFKDWRDEKWRKALLKKIYLFEMNTSMKNNSFTLWLMSESKMITVIRDLYVHVVVLFSNHLQDHKTKKKKKKERKLWLISSRSSQFTAWKETGARGEVVGRPIVTIELRFVAQLSRTVFQIKQNVRRIVVGLHYFPMEFIVCQYFDFGIVEVQPFVGARCVVLASTVNARRLAITRSDL